MVNLKTLCLACCITLLTACGSDSEFKRQIDDSGNDYLNTTELKPLMTYEGLSVPRQSEQYKIPKSLFEGDVGYALDIRPPVIPKSVVGIRARYNENGVVITSIIPDDWSKISQAIVALKFPIVQETDQIIETGTIVFDGEGMDETTKGQFEVRKLNATEIAFQTVSLTRSRNILDKDFDKQRYTLMFYNLIMSEIEFPNAKFTSNLLANYLNLHFNKKTAQEEDQAVLKQFNKLQSQKQPKEDVVQKNSQVTIDGVGNLMISIARCCRPIPGDSIAGFITQGRGISIHRVDCEQFLELSNHLPERIVHASWNITQKNNFSLLICVIGLDRTGLLRDITTVFANEKVLLRDVNCRNDAKNEVITFDFEVELNDVSILNRLLLKIEQIQDVISAKRFHDS